MGKTADKLVVKIAEPQKGADIFDFCWGGPVLDARNFYQVHASHPLFKHYPQVINVGNMEVTFRKFDKEVVCYVPPSCDCRISITTSVAS